MSNVILIIQFILALVLIGIVLLQRSEGGGLGIGGGGVMTGRQAATALGKVTWIVAVAFLSVSLVLTIFTAREQAGDSVIERLGETPANAEDTSSPLAGEDLLPPTLPNTPALPPKVE